MLHVHAQEADEYTLYIQVQYFGGKKKQKNIKGGQRGKGFGQADGNSIRGNAFNNKRYANVYL